MTTLSDPATEAALVEVDRRRDSALAFLSELVALQASGEDAVQAAVAARLEALGAEVGASVYDPASVPVTAEFAAAGARSEGERRNVVARLEGAGQGRSLLVFAHPDSEPTAAARGWRHDPFAAVVENGRMHGWGIADDLAGIAAGVIAIEAIRRSGARLAGDLLFASTPSKRHARGIAAVLHQGAGADGALYLHPAESGAGMVEIKALASGLLEFSVEVAGEPPHTAEPGHTAFAHRAVHPLDKAELLIDALRRLDAERGRRIRHPLLEAAVGRSTNILVSEMHFGQPGLTTRVPDRLSFTASVSFPPPETLESVRAEIETALAEAVATDPFLAAHPPVVRFLAGVTGSEVAESDPLYATLSGAIRAVAGIEPRVNPMHTSSDIRNPLVQKGIPALGFGSLCGDLTQARGHDEWVDVEDWLRMVKVTAACILAWCGVAGSRTA
ncbi:M20/M25/M40 family metallo-hydrolase [Kaistia geumhonensis]|uniref:Acetylornithine deacetylase n=1 Tax=Kaistia geumhonensis TaxID=410839 RepID=A0ABU0M9G2_9HYPH|nr:M20/M25/M40 family metallo-hydrolase [Kaistia geumhonensis]MCX5480692.1 M20/M25/M40 family metallo-hydrolase [Kaistia geumhonensis]MDQ0517604.1 acetylornithine deacetylase [Kaistia geumhonensis]